APGPLKRTRKRLQIRQRHPIPHHSIRLRLFCLRQRRLRIHYFQHRRLTRLVAQVRQPQRLACRLHALIQRRQLLPRHLRLVVELIQFRQQPLLRRRQRHLRRRSLRHTLLHAIMRRKPIPYRNIQRRRSRVPQVLWSPPESPSHPSAHRSQTAERRSHMSSSAKAPADIPSAPRTHHPSQPSKPPSPPSHRDYSSPPPHSPPPDPEPPESRSHPPACTAFADQRTAESPTPAGHSPPAVVRSLHPAAAVVTAIEPSVHPHEPLPGPAPAFRSNPQNGLPPSRPASLHPASSPPPATRNTAAPR